MHTSAVRRYLSSSSGMKDGAVTLATSSEYTLAIALSIKHRYMEELHNDCLSKNKETNALTNNTRIITLRISLANQVVDSPRLP